MRIGSVLIIIWLIIGAIAANQRGYFSDNDTNCAEASTIFVTIIAGPLNYFGDPTTRRSSLPWSAATAARSPSTRLLSFGHGSVEDVLEHAGNAVVVVDGGDVVHSGEDVGVGVGHRPRAAGPGQ